MTEPNEKTKVLFIAGCYEREDRREYDSEMKYLRLWRAAWLAHLAQVTPVKNAVQLAISVGVPRELVRDYFVSMSLILQSTEPQCVYDLKYKTQLLHALLKDQEAEELVR